MKTIIPVAGVGTRLRPHTFTVPKVLLNVAGKPILGHLLDHLQEAGIQSVTIVVGPMGDLIEKYVRDNYKFEATFITQLEARGLGHAVSLALTEDDDDILIVLGDTLFDFDLKTVLNTSKTSAIGVAKVEDPRRFGVVEVENSRVTRLVEKPENPKSNLVIIGVYLIRNSAGLRRAIKMLFDRNLTTQGEFQLTDALQLMIEEGEPIGVFPIDGWHDCRKVETLLETNRFLLDQDPECRTPAPRAMTVLVPPVYIHPSAKIENAIIGPYATIAEGAIVTDAMVRNSIVGQGAEVRAALVEGSLVGNNAGIVGQFKHYNVGDSSEILSSNT
ncbi:NTP transferase domain-containing protein [bacterium]|nr:NTP transferase domain-containing protein [bacterium]